MVGAKNWMGPSYFLAGVVMTTAAAVWQNWFSTHPWIIVPLVLAWLFCLLMAARESEQVRAFFWRHARQIVPLPSRIPQPGTQLLDPEVEPPNQPRIQITITEGVTALALNDHTHLWILLNVHVNGPTIEVPMWMLDLKIGGKGRAVFQIPIPENLRYSPHPYPSDGKLGKTEPLKLWLPDSGWLFFTVPGLSANDLLIDLIFGATFVLTAVERNGLTTDSTKLPGPWLNRATEIFPSED
jgi:hypothetical protein